MHSKFITTYDDIQYEKVSSSFLGVSGGGMEDEQRKQEERDDKERISNRRAGKELISGYQNDLLLSVSMSDTNKLNIPNGRLASKWMISLLSFSLGAGDGKDGNGQGEYAYNQSRQQKRLSKRVHTQFPFLASKTLINQHASVNTAPTTITGQRVLSMPLKTGDSTTTARNTLPALSNMFDKRSNWLDVNTGSLGAMNMMKDAFINDYDSIASTQKSMNYLFAFTKRVVCLVTLFFLVAFPVSAQSDSFDKLVSLEVGQKVRLWVTTQGIPVANTDLRSSATLVYSFPSSDPAAPHIVRVKDTVMTAIILTVPVNRLAQYQDIFFNNRYTRELLRQDTKETAYFIPSSNFVLVMDATSGQVVRIEKSTHSSDGAQEDAPLDTPNKTLILTILVVSVVLFAGVMTTLMISMIRWKPKGDTYILPPEAYPR